LIQKDQGDYIYYYQDTLLNELIKDEDQMMAQSHLNIVERTSLIAWLLKVCRKSNVNDRGVFYLSL
jgi:hypothetical protein